MAYHHTAPAAMPAHAQPNQNAARTERINQVQFVEERLRNGISPAAVAGITALLAQLETQPTLPSLAVSIVADVVGYKRTMTCRNGVWDGCDLTHPFLDDRSTAVRGPSVQTAIRAGGNPANSVRKCANATALASTSSDSASSASTPAIGNPSSALCQCSRGPCAAHDS